MSESTDGHGFFVGDSYVVRPDLLDRAMRTLWNIRRSRNPDFNLPLLEYETDGLREDLRAEA